MKIPASKVPAQVWADKMRTEGDLSEAESERLRRWDSSKQVYRVNSTLWDELKIDNKDEIPVSVFSKLPYDCIFIERKDSFTVPLPLGDLISDVLDADGNMIISTNGHFCWCENEKLYISPLIDSVYLKIEDVTKRNVLYERTCFNCSIDLKNSVTFDEVMKDLKSYISVSMNDENLDKGSARMRRIINEMHTEGRKTVFDNPLAKSFFKLIPKKMLSEALKSYARSTWLDIASHDLEKLLGTLMYISSKEADVRTVYVPQKNQTRKSRQTDCTVHDVGFRVAPQLGEVRRVYEHEAKGQDGGKTGRHVAPHVRRGHWHGYWTGPRENPTGLEIKWVAPTIVNGSRGELEGTVHEVGDRDGRYTLKSTQRECGRAAEQLNGAGRSEEQARDGKSDR